MNSRKEMHWLMVKMKNKQLYFGTGIFLFGILYEVFRIAFYNVVPIFGVALMFVGAIVLVSSPE